MFRFESLPEELKVRILDYFFEDGEGVESPSTRHSEVSHPVKENSIYLPSPCIDCSASPWTKDLHFRHHQHITGNLRAFPALFTSKSFLNTALPVYARSTSLKFSSIELLHQIHRSSRPSILNDSILKILSHIRTLTIPTDEHLVASSYTSLFRIALPSLNTLVYQDSDILVWSRFQICVFSDNMRLRPIVFEDVFQTTAIAHICRDNTRVVVSDAELRALKGKEKIFPGDLTLLCRYIGSVSKCHYPREIHRMVTIGCYADLSSSEELSGLSGDLTRQKILIDLKIDIRALAVLAVDIRVEEWTEQTRINRFSVDTRCVRPL